MKNNTQPRYFQIQEGEWIVTIPTKTKDTLEDLEAIVNALRNGKALAMKTGWKVSHI